MPGPRKYDQETRYRAVRMYQERRRDSAGSALQAHRRVGELLDVKPDTLRGWVERAGIDAGQRPGVPSPVEARIKELERDNAELRRANEILKTASASSPRPGLELVFIVQPARQHLLKPPFEGRTRIHWRVAAGLPA